MGSSGISTSSSDGLGAQRLHQDLRCSGSGLGSGDGVGLLPSQATLVALDLVLRPIPYPASGVVDLVSGAADLASGAVDLASSNLCPWMGASAYPHFFVLINQGGQSTRHHGVCINNDL